MSNWAESVAKEFGGADFGDRRLEKRCRELAGRLSGQPDRSIPQACGTWGDTKAAYRFFDNERVTRDKLMAPHIEQTVQRASGREAILVVQDTTSLNMGAREAQEGFGSIGSLFDAQGVLAHSAMAVAGDNGEVLGLLHQEVWVRTDRKPRDERTATRRLRPRESERWVRGIENVRALGLKTRVIHVFDREGDIYEALDLLERSGQSYVIRAKANRRLSGGDYLLDAINNKAELGRMMIDVPGREGRPARKAELVLAAATMRIRPPLELKSPTGREIDVGIIRVTEVNAPEDAEALEWHLLTGEPHERLQDCIRAVECYAKRWKIEEFHMGLKTGCRVEERQLHSRRRLEVFLGFANVIAVMLIRLRDLSRRNETDEVLNPVQKVLLRKKYPKLQASATNRDILRAVAQLGGFLGRKGDGEPGWRTIWRGMHSLLLMEYGVLLGSDARPVTIYG